MRWRTQGSEADDFLLAMEVPEEVKVAMASATAPPAPPTPPTTGVQQPDRKPHDGYTGEFTFGEPTAGAGAFIRFGQHLGGKCLWFAEQDTEAAALAQQEAPTATAYSDLLAVNPLHVPEVFCVLGGPECQPFSAAGKQNGFRDKRSNTLLWFFWCLAERQFPTALIENSMQLLRSNGGDDWRLCLALAEASGYHLSVQRDDAHKWGYAEVRQRVFISLIRMDLFKLWGSVPDLVHPEMQRRQQIEDTMLPPQHPLVRAEVAAFSAVMADLKMQSRWVEHTAEQRRRRIPGHPLCVWKAGDGKWGKRAFAHATPAHKVFGDLP